jgi:uncharacterized membrane protein
MIEDPMNYKAGVFYFNRKDSRIVVPKRSKPLAWTLNFGNIYSYILIIFILAFGFLMNYLHH